MNIKISKYIIYNLMHLYSYSTSIDLFQDLGENVRLK